MESQRKMNWARTAVRDNWFDDKSFLTISDLKTGEGYEEKYQISHLTRHLAEKLTSLLGFCHEVSLGMGGLHASLWTSLIWEINRWMKPPTRTVEVCWFSSHSIFQPCIYEGWGPLEILFGEQGLGFGTFSVSAYALLIEVDSVRSRLHSDLLL